MKLPRGLDQIFDLLNIMKCEVVKANWAFFSRLTLVEPDWPLLVDACSLLAFYPPMFVNCHHHLV